MKNVAMLTLVALGCSAGAAQEAPPPPTPELLEGFRQEIDLACRLHRALTAGHSEENGFFSPASISSALAMVAEGARGVTALELARVLQGLEVPNLDALRALHGDLNMRLAAASIGVEWNEANGIWADDEALLVKSTQKALEESYGALIQSADFQGEFDAVRKEINRWVEAQTKDRIQDLMPEGTVNALTRVVLVNAVHFLGSWDEKFEEELTEDLPFTLEDGTKVKAPFLQDKRDLRVGFFGDTNERLYAPEEAALTVFELPYEGGELSFVGLIPGSPQGLSALEERLDSALLSTWLKGLGSREVLFAMPKLELAPSYDLMPVLRDLGLAGLLDADRADLSGFFGEDADQLAVTSGVHKAFLKVDEAGTEAAAATGVVAGVASAPAAPPTVRADRPYLLLIRHRATGAILFMGRIVNPNA